MDWTTCYNELKAGIEGLGYTQQPENKDIDDKNTSNLYTHFGYSVKMTDIRDREITNNSSINCFEVEIKVSYISITTSNRNANAQSFVELKEKFFDETVFPKLLSFVRNSGKLTDLNDDQSITIGTFKVLYGLRSC